MKKKLLIGIGLVVVVVFGAWLAAAPVVTYKAGDVAPALSLLNIHGAKVSIPDPKSKWVHLQFRRFGGCPICNLHLQSFLQRYKEIEAAGIHEVVIFHSPNASLLPYQGKFPFDVVGDPEKIHYRIVLIHIEA